MAASENARSMVNNGMRGEKRFFSSLVFLFLTNLVNNVGSVKVQIRIVTPVGDYNEISNANVLSKSN